LLLIVVFLLGTTGWAIFITANLLIEGPKRNWPFIVILGIIWAFFAAFLMFQIRYSHRIVKLMEGVYHKSFKRKRMFSTGVPIDVVNKRIRHVLKKKRFKVSKGETKFRIPEIGKYRHNLYLPKFGVRLIIRKTATYLPGDGSILLVPEKTTQGQLDELKDIITDALE